jgi:alpha-beta hydrolase superfamily lysophospholipase
MTAPAPLITPDGLRLHWRHWPAGSDARGTVQIVHGLGEHIGRYDALARALNAAGWHVAGHDQRGHGRSEGARGAIDQPHALLADLALAFDAVAAGQRRGAPHVLLGHSLGGLVAARFVAEGLVANPARWQREPAALVLSSPALDPGLSAGQQLLLALLGRLAPQLGVGNGLKPAWISRDPAVVQAYVDDPLVHRRVTPRLVRFIVDAGRTVHALAPGWRVPTLLLWAGADRCVRPDGSVRFAAAAPKTVVDAQAFDGLFHEIFNEPERDAVVARLTGWLADRFPVAGRP